MTLANTGSSSTARTFTRTRRGPNGLGQTVGMWLVDRNTLYRERMTKGVVDERVMYRVSPDGQTLVWTNFNADGASGHVVWDRIKLTPTHGPAH